MRRCLQGPELHAAVARVLTDHLDPTSHRAWIVGSEATGRALPGSDVDIVIEGPAAIDLAVLARLRGALDGLPTIRSFDIVDLRRTSERFRREALTSAIDLFLGQARAPHVQE